MENPTVRKRHDPGPLFTAVTVLLPVNSRLTQTLLTHNPLQALSNSNLILRFHRYMILRTHVHVHVDKLELAFTNFMVFVKLVVLGKTPLNVGAAIIAVLKHAT